MGHEELDERPTVGVDTDHPLHVTTRRLPAAVVVAAAGEIDLATAEDLAVVVRAAFRLRPGTVVVDLSEVQFLASAGLSVLIEAERAASGTGQLLYVVVGEHRSVTRSLATSGLADRLALFHDLDDALRSD
jgi:anti-sigma B factor antagonist